MCEVNCGQGWMVAGNHELTHPPHIDRRRKGLHHKFRRDFITKRDRIYARLFRVLDPAYMPYRKFA